MDRLTQGADHPTPPIPFICSQCGTDFSSLWKWDKAATRKSPPPVVAIIRFCFLFRQCLCVSLGVEVIVGIWRGDDAQPVWLIHFFLNSREACCYVRPVRDE